MLYDLDLRQTNTGYVSGEAINVDLLTAWLTSGGITVTSIAADLVDPWIIHVDASAEPDLTDSWPLFWNNTSWHPGDPLPTPPDIEAGEPPDEAPQTVTYTLNIASTALGFTPGNAIRVDLISQYLADKGNDAQSVTADTATGMVTVVRLASGSNISGPNWAAYNGGASVTVYGQASIGDPPVDAASLQSPQQGTRYGDGSSATGSSSTSIGKDAKASGNSSSAFGDHATASGSQSTAVGKEVVSSGSNSSAYGDHAVASGDVSTALGNFATASKTFGVATGAGAVATGAGAVTIGSSTSVSGDYAVSVGYQSQSASNFATALGAQARVNGSSDRSIAIGNAANVPSSTPDVGVIRVNSVELVPSRPLGTNDPTVLKLHASDGSIHTIGVNPTTGVLTIDGTPVLTAIAIGYITSAMIANGTIDPADLSAVTLAYFATASALASEASTRSTNDGTLASAISNEITNRSNADSTLQTAINTKVSRSFVAVGGATISTTYVAAGVPATVGSFNLALPNDGKTYDIAFTGRYSGRRTTSGTATTARIGCSIDGNDRGGPIRSFYVDDNEYAWDHTVAIVGAGQNVPCSVIITATSFTGGLTSAGWNGIATATPRS